MIFFLTFASLSATGLLLLIHAACSAPEGEEDTRGFRFVGSGHSETTTPAQHSAAEHGGLSIVSR